MKLLTAFLLLLELSTSQAVDCTGLPDNALLAARLQVLVDSDGGEGGDTVIVQGEPYYTCKVQGSTMGTYQQLSVIMVYNTTDNSDPRVRQYEWDCVDLGGGTWDSRSGSLTTVDSSVDYKNIDVRTNCSSCTNTAGNDHHCECKLH